jgi:hypothetical protein
MVWLFVMGSGMATPQTAINPLLRVAGGEEHCAFNLAVEFEQRESKRESAVAGSGQAHSRGTSMGLDVLDLPRVERTADESAGSWSMYDSLFRKPVKRPAVSRPQNHETAVAPVVCGWDY